MAFTIAPRDFVEYKYRLDKGQALLYSWSATAAVTYELHAEPDGAPKGYAESYEKQPNTREASGTLTAPFSGIHGWYWENTGSQPVTVTLKSAGFYTMSHEFHKDMPVKNRIFCYGTPETCFRASDVARGVIPRIHEGNVNLALTPPSEHCSSAIAPPYASARSRTIASPSPEPGDASSALTPRFSTCPRIAALNPAPSSSTSITTRPLSMTAEIATRDLVHLQALSRRLPIISSRSSSGTRTTQSGGTLACIDNARSAYSRSIVRTSPATASATLVRAVANPGGRPCLRQVRIDLALHARDLLTDGTGEIVLSRRLSTGDLLRQNRQRRLQSVREVAGPRRGAGDAPFAIVEQPVQIINQRRHLVWILTFEPAASSRRTSLRRSRSMATGESPRRITERPP